MSEKYSTDELVKSIEETYLERMDLFERFIGSCPQRNAQYDRRDAIIARLRAADGLLDVAKNARIIVSMYCVEHIKEYDKAIAGYEGKEGEK